MTNGIKFKIQRSSVEGIFFKEEVWNDLGRPVLGCSAIFTKYYDTLSDVRVDFDKFVEHDRKLTEWTEVSV
jgi:hypothetical protein